MKVVAWIIKPDLQLYYKEEDKTGRMTFMKKVYDLGFSTLPDGGSVAQIFDLAEPAEKDRLKAIAQHFGKFQQLDRPGIVNYTDVPGEVFRYEALISAGKLSRKTMIIEPPYAEPYNDGLIGEGEIG